MTPRNYAMQEANAMSSTQSLSKEQRIAHLEATAKAAHKACAVIRISHNRRGWQSSMLIYRDSRLVASSFYAWFATSRMALSAALERLHDRADGPLPIWYVS